MRPGNRWNGDTTSSTTAALYCALVALVVAFALSYLFGRFGLGVVSARYAWSSPRAFQLAALNLYASQHVPLIANATIPGEDTPTEAAVTFPVTLWAAVPFLALMLGGYLAGKSRTATGRWGMVSAAVAGGVIYTAVLAGAANVVSAKFVSTALPPLNATEFNPPPIPFGPSLAAVPWACGIFAVISTYLGAILALRLSPQPSMAGKWWSCAKAVVIAGLLIQLLIALAGVILFTGAEGVEGEAQAKFVQILPTVAGTGYAAVHGAVISYGAVPTRVPSAGYSGRVHLYRGATMDSAGETSKNEFGPYVWIAAALAGLMAFVSGRLAVRLGSRDGSLPTAVRIVIMQAAYTALIMWLCGFGWGIASQFRAYVRLMTDPAMLPAALGVFVLALLGAHWANRRYVGRLVGYPSA